MIKIFTTEFLLFLQELRVASGGIFDPFFATITNLGNLPIILLFIGIIYWSYDKKLGEYLLVSLAFSRIVNSFAKLTACVYRPWISDSRIKPYAGVLKDATGYSFPSGHATSGTIFFLGASLKGKFTKGLKIFLVVAFAVLCFTRCWFGVHYLTDIIGGIILSLIVLWIVSKLFDKLESNPNFDLIILTAGIVFSILLLVYATFKAYPMDYDAAGKLIVDPAKMAVDAYKDVGFTLGILIPWVIERRFINFSADGPNNRRIMRVVGAVVGYPFLMYVIYPLIKASLSAPIAALINFFMFPCYVILIIPLIIKFFQKRNPDIYNNESDTI